MSSERRQELGRERALVRKLDVFILSFCCLGYFLNYVSE